MSSIPTPPRPPADAAAEQSPDDSLAPVADDAAEPSSAAPAHRTHPLTPLVSVWAGLVGAALLIGRETLDEGASLDSLLKVIIDPATPIILGLGLVLSIGWGFVRWLTTRYRLESDGLVIEQRFISHASKQTPYRKVQSVDIRQPFSARLLGLCELRVEVGGDGSSQLRYLTRGAADQLRQDLLSRAVRARAPQAPASTVENAAHAPGEGDGPVPRDVLPERQHTASLPDLTDPGRLIVQVQPRTLILGHLADRAWIWPLLITAGTVVFALWTGSELSLGLLIPLWLSMGVVYVRQVVKEWRFRVEETRHGLRISCGLTDLATSTTPTARVQGLRLHQPLLARPLGLWSVRAAILGNESDDEDSISDMVLPLGTWEEAMRVAHAIWPGVDLDRVPMRGVPRRARWFLWWGWRQHLWGMDQEVAVTRHGRFGRTVNVIDHSRAQSLSLTQDPLDRRLDLASVQFHLIQSPVSVEFTWLDLRDAQAVVRDHPALARGVRERRRALGTRLVARVP